MGRLKYGLLVVGGLFVFAVGPVAAAEALTNTGRLIHQLSDLLLAVALPVTLITEAFLFYGIWRFSRNDDPKPTTENRRLEISWTLATAIILVFVGVTAFTVMAHPFVMPSEAAVEQQLQQGNPVVVDVVGSQWSWTFEYPQHNITTTGTMVLPANRPIVMRITSTDVIHSVFVPKLALKKDAIPGRTTYLMTTMTSEAIGHNYTMFCAEYCGNGHSTMLADVRVVSQQQYQQWLAEQGASGGGSSAQSSTNTTRSNATANRSNTTNRSNITTRSNATANRTNTTNATASHDGPIARAA